MYVLHVAPALTFYLVNVAIANRFFDAPAADLDCFEQLSDVLARRFSGSHVPTVTHRTWLDWAFALTPWVTTRAAPTPSSSMPPISAARGSI